MFTSPEYYDEEVGEAGSQMPILAFAHLPEPEPESEPALELELEDSVFATPPVEPRRVAEAPPGMPPEEQAQAARLFITRNFLPQPPERVPVLQFLQRQMIEAAVVGNYKEADRFWVATQRFIDACHQSDARDVKDDAADLIDTQLFGAARDLERIGTKWNVRIANLTDEFANRLERARAKTPRVRHVLATARELAAVYENVSTAR
jgi:hypothetical protein